MLAEQKSPFDLEERTLLFSNRILNMVETLPKDNINACFINQCIRSGTSVGANYREANDALGKKDFVLRLRIARKEAKETIYWIMLIMKHNPKMAKRIELLLQESIELKNILSSIIQKTNTH